MTIQTTYNLAPVPRWLFTDLTGNVLSNGRLWTYEDLDQVTPKVAYQDINGLNPWTDPIPFELNGMPDGAIYWASDSNYYLAVFDQNDVPQFTVSHYNAPFANQINPAPKFVKNYFRNPQFTFWNNSNNYPNIGYSQNIYDYVADDWIYLRNNNNATVNISQGLFNPGQIDVPFNPIGFFHYECTNSGAGGQTQNAWAQTYQSAQTFSGETVTIAFWARSSTSSPLTAKFIQNFGTGGSPSAENPAGSFSIANLTTTWQQYFATINIESVTGKTFGTNRDDYLRFEFDLPLNSIAEIDIANTQNQLGSALSDFPYLTLNDQQKQLDYLIQGIPTTGDFKTTLKSGASAGWVVCNDGTVGNQQSNASFSSISTKALFELIWNTISNNFAPVFNSDGSPATRGATAEQDYNANRQIALTKTLGRILATAGQAVLSMVFTADDTTDLLTIPNSASFYTGTPIMVSTTDTLPNPLAPATTYYVILVDTTHIKLATSLANALSGTAINITTTGAGIQTITITYMASWEPGQVAGEYVHALSGEENGPHTHHLEATESNVYASGSGDSALRTETPTPGFDTMSAGLGSPHNNIQPTTFLYTHLKL